MEPNYKELLTAEIKKRQAQDQQDTGKIRGMLNQSDKAAMVDPQFRQDLTPIAAYVDQLTGSKLARTVEAPESSEDAFRRALQTRVQAPKAKFLESLQMGMNQENTEAKMQAARLKAGKGKALSGEDRKRLGSARVAKQALADVEEALSKGSSILPEFMTGASGDNYFTEASRRFAEGFGRMQSGGAINADENVRFLRLLPRFQDSPEIRERKLSRLREEINARVGELDGSPMQTAQPTQDGSFDMQSLSDAQLAKMAGL